MIDQRLNIIIIIIIIYKVLKVRNTAFVEVYDVTIFKMEIKNIFMIKSKKKNIIMA